LIVGQQRALVAVINAPQNAVKRNNHVVANRNTTFGHDFAMAANVDIAPQAQTFLAPNLAGLLQADVVGRVHGFFATASQEKRGLRPLSDDNPR
jgi:hypothetical protein